MKYFAVVLFALVLLAPATGLCQFIILEPSQNIVTDEDENEVMLDMRFSNPFEYSVIQMQKPLQVGVLFQGQKTDLMETLQEVLKGKTSTWTAKYSVPKPGDYVFYVEQSPFWKTSENKYLIQYVKTVVNNREVEEGWNALVGSPIEIKPMVRPYGLWAGNTFQGQVLVNGKPHPGAKVKITYSNPNFIAVDKPTTYYIQVVTADQNGVFTYAMPRAGWWGFAASTEALKKMIGPDGAPKPVEINGVIWVHCVDMK